MRRELRLVPRGSDDLIVVDWDDETGAIEGEGYEYVTVAVLRYESGAQIPCMPEGSGYTLSAEPRKSLPDMAVILHDCFRIPDWLMEHYPAPDEGEDEGEDLTVTPLEH